MNQETINRLNKAREHNSNWIPARMFWRGIAIVGLFWAVVAIITVITILIQALWKY